MRQGTAPPSASRGREGEPIPRRYPKRIRLCGRKDIERVFQAGRYRRLGVLNAKFLPSTLPEPRFLVSVKRKIGKAHKRNRIRRLVKEAIRLTRFRLHGSFDICLVLTVAPENPSLAAFERELGRLFDELSMPTARENR